MTQWLKISAWPKTHRQPEPKEHVTRGDPRTEIMSNDHAVTETNQIP